MNILIIGSGFVGMYLATGFHRKGATVCIASRKKPADVAEGILWYGVDIANASQVTAVVRKKFDVIINCAGYSGQIQASLRPKVSREVNVQGTINLLEAVRNFSPYTRVILIGSRLEYGKVLYLPVDEKHPTHPLHAYGIDKLEATTQALMYYSKYGVRTTVLRVSNVYGPHTRFQFNKYNVINYLLDQAEDGNDIEVFGVGDQKRDFLYIDDLFTAFMKVLQCTNTIGQVYNIGYGKSVTFTEMAQAIADEAHVRVIHKAWPKDFLGVETGDYISDIRKFVRSTGWKPRVWYKQGVQKSFTRPARNKEY
jgi:nucleoside-diphosphate-sugar epimerase